MKPTIVRALAIFSLALLCVSSQAADILWVSFHPGDDTPSGAAVTAGFTQAPDIGYTDLLRNNGHNVTRVATVNDAQTAIDPNLIAAAELIIISRSVDSSHYREDGETAFWNGLAKPIIILGGYVLRGGADGNARLGFTTGSTIPDVNSNPVRLTVNNPSHPIFAGIALDGANLMVNPYAHGVTYTGTVQRGISVNTSPIAAGGTVLATVGTMGDAAFGGMVVGEWAAGGTMGNSPPDTLGGPRLVVLTGSRENAAIAGGAAALTSQGAGIYDLDPDGAQILLNAIDYLVPPVPTTYREAVLADGPLVYFSFSDAGTTAANSGSLGAAADGTYMNGAVSGVEAPRPPQFVGFEADNVAAQLDGVDDFVQSASGVLNDLPNVTLSAWIRRAGAQRGRTGILGQNDIIEFGYIDNNTLQAWVDNFTTPVNIVTPFPDAEWDHVALVVDGANLRMTTYTNGQAAGTAALNSATYGANANFLVVGGDAFGNGVSFNGQIDEAAVFDKALTADQIGAHYFTAVASPPIIVRQPEGTNLFEGETLRLSVGAIGTPRLRYQWLYFGTELSGQTGPSLVISNAAPEHTGTYAVRVRNDFGEVESTGVDVIVNATQPPTITRQPQSLVRYAGRTATFSVVAIGGLNLNYQWKKGPDDIPGATSATLTLNSVSAADEGTYSVVVSNPAGSTPSDNVTLDVITPAPGSYEAAVVAGDPMAYWRLGETSGSIAYDSWGGNDGAYSNVVLGAAGALNGDADFAADFTGNSAVRTPLSLNNTPAYTALGWMNRSGTQAARTGLWGQDGKMEFGYINDNQLQVWTDNALNVTPNPYPNGEWGFLAVVSDGTTVSLYTNGLLAGTRNHTIPANNPNTFNIGGGGIFDPTGNFFLGRIDDVAVYNRALSGDDVANLYFIGSAAAPIITQQPQGTNFFQGGTLRLCVTAFGAPPLTYKWLFFGTEVAGQTGPCLEILNASPADSGTYQVEVGSPAGTVLSAEAVVDIAPANPPIITQNPQSATRYVGGSVSLSGAATGSEPLSYQWQRNGADVPGANGTTLALNNLQPGNAGDYTLIAINFMGRATSAVATLTVLAPPAGSYEAAVVAGGPIAYWRLGETSGTTAFDYVGGNNGTYNNVTLGAGGAIPGDPDTAAAFDGTSSYVGTPLSLNDLSAFSMIGWIQRGADQANRTGLWGQNDKVEFGYINNNTIQLWTDNALNITPNPFPNGEWAFLAVVSDGPTVSIYTNGLLAGTRSHTIQANNANLFNIGGGGIFDVTGNFFNGLIDEVAVYNRALSAAEVDALHALTDVNACPTAGDVNASVPQGGTVTVQLVYSDPDGDPQVGLMVTQSPAHGVLSPGPSVNELRYTPDPGYCGPDSFRYTVSDGQCSSAPATVNITVVCNQCPVANAGSVTVDQGASVSFALSASDPENDPLTYLVTQPPMHGEVVVNANTGQASYTPNPGYCGPDSFRFRVRDTVCGESAEATVSITVNCLNLPPTDCVAGIIPEECTVTLSDGTVTVLAVNGTDACVIFGGSATDPEGQPLQHTWTSNGVAFAAGPVATNCFAVGCHTVTFTSTDPFGASCSANVNFCVVTPSEAVEDCIALVDGSGVTRKNLRPLISTLKAAAASFDRGNFTAGLNQLNAFQNKVRAQIVPDNPAEAEDFIKCAQRIAEALVCSGLVGGE